MTCFHSTISLLHQTLKATASSYELKYKLNERQNKVRRIVNKSVPNPSQALCLWPFGLR